jgi:hypothetical protein
MWKRVVLVTVMVLVAVLAGIAFVSLPKPLVSPLPDIPPVRLIFLTPTPAAGVATPSGKLREEPIGGVDVGRQ